MQQRETETSNNPLIYGANELCYAVFLVLSDEMECHNTTMGRKISHENNKIKL
jgi:hypothetical protein